MRSSYAKYLAHNADRLGNVSQHVWEGVSMTNVDDIIPNPFVIPKLLGRCQADWAVACLDRTAVNRRIFGTWEFAKYELIF
jgi:hypothetical protein